MPAKNEESTNYQKYLLIIAFMALIIAILSLFIQLYFNSNINIPEYMKAIIVLIIFTIIVFVIMLLELGKLKSELHSLKNEVEILKSKLITEPRP